MSQTIGEWYKSSAGTGLSATIGGFAGLGATSVADFTGAFDVFSTGISAALSAINVQADPEAVSAAVKGIAYFLFGAYMIFGAIRKFKNKVV